MAVVASVLFFPILLYFLLGVGTTIVQATYLLIYPAETVYSANYDLHDESKNEEEIVLLLESAFQQIGCDVNFDYRDDSMLYLEHAHCSEGRVTVSYAPVIKSIFFHREVWTRGSGTDLDKNAKEFSKILEGVSDRLEEDLPVRPTQKAGWTMCFPITDKSGDVRRCSWNYRERVFE